MLSFDMTRAEAWHALTTSMLRAPATEIFDVLRDLRQGNPGRPGHRTCKLDAL